jgi:DNA-binding HxlR family transcriptional regulator
MVKRTSLDDAECPVARALDAIGDWWTLLIVRDALGGVRRFSEFQKNLKIARGILATRLRRLVALGVFEQVAAGDGGGYRDYVLTSKGRDLFLVVAGLRQWGEAHCFAPGEAHSTLVEADSGQPVGQLQLHGHDGRVLGPDDTVVAMAAG